MTNEFHKKRKQYYVQMRRAILIAILFIFCFYCFVLKTSAEANNNFTDITSSAVPSKDIVHQNPTTMPTQPTRAQENPNNATKPSTPELEDVLGDYEEPTQPQESIPSEPAPTPTVPEVKPTESEVKPTEPPVDFEELEKPNESIEPVIPSEPIAPVEPEYPPETTQPTPAEPPVCRHTNTTVVRIDPSCTENGIESVICADCGEVLTEDILEQTNHTYSEYNLTQKPTENKNGVETAKCISCGYEIRREYICKHNSTYETIQTPTIEKEGFVSVRCDLCKKEVKRDVIAKLNKINLSAYTALSPFYHLDVNMQGICNKITSYISEGYDNGFPNAGIAVVSDLRLTWSEIDLITSTLQIYYGEFHNVFEMLIFMCSNGGEPGVYKVNIYIEADIAMKLEKNRRFVETSLENALTNFVEGDTESLLFQIFDYLDKHTVYGANHPNTIDVFESKKGSCNAFAILFRQMCLRLGIKCDMVIGHTSSGGYHAWNRVAMEDGNYLYYDIPFWKTAHNAKFRGGSKELHIAEKYNEYSEE